VPIGKWNVLLGINPGAGWKHKMVKVLILLALVAIPGVIVCISTWLILKALNLFVDIL
jgi:hypothetical protein